MHTTRIQVNQPLSFTIVACPYTLIVNVTSAVPSTTSTSTGVLACPNQSLTSANPASAPRERLIAS